MVKKRSIPAGSAEKTDKPKAKRIPKPVVPRIAEIEVKAENSPVSNGSFHDEIALLAYSYWEERGCQGGSAEDDWLRAEQVILNR